jgi:uncharacterized protein YprB with RNaseH-like and TPR domain
VNESSGVTTYLDIETSWAGTITVIGVYCTANGLVQLVGRDVCADRLCEAIPEGSELVTFNGHCFDLPVIRRHLGVNLRERCDSRDLRFIARRLGYTGGLKAIEVLLGIPRRLAGLNGLDAMRLWERAQRTGDRHALATLLAYNEEDVVNLVALESRLAALAPAAG